VRISGRQRHKSVGAWGSKTKSLIPHFWHSSSKIAPNSEPPSTCIALTGKGILISRASKKWAAVLVLAQLWTLTTSHRDITSLPVKCLRVIPGRGLTSSMSTSTISPGLLARYSLGFFLLAHAPYPMPQWLMACHVQNTEY